MKTFIVPAVIAKTQIELDDMLNRVKKKVQRVQLDIMDGKFVPNTSLNFNFKLSTSFEYEAHLMINEPLGWVKENADKVDIVIMHVETLKDIGGAIDYVKKKIDGLLVMTVEPGSYCIKKEFRPEPLKKIRRLRTIDKVIPIEVDGCMNPKNAKLARDAGANIFASGSYIFKSDNLDMAIKELENAVV
jgi:ribulose-phosphate 3-epimerase